MVPFSMEWLLESRIGSNKVRLRMLNGEVRLGKVRLVPSTFLTRFLLGQGFEPTNFITLLCPSQFYSLNRNESPRSGCN